MIKPRSLSVEELANGYCLTMGNAYRLVEDGEKLMKIKRYIGAVGLFRVAIDEITKAHMITKAVMFDKEDSRNWNWFWESINDPYEKLNILEDDILKNIYKNGSKAHSVLVHEFLGVSFDEDLEKFSPPGDNLMGQGNDEETAHQIYDTVMGLFHAFNINGLPKTQVLVETFRALQLYSGEPIRLG